MKDQHILDKMKGKTQIKGYNNSTKEANEITMARGIKEGQEQLEKDIIAGKKKLTCSQCNKKIKEGYNHSVDLSFGYGSKYDEEHYEFCSDECYIKWTQSNQKFKNFKKEQDLIKLKIKELFRGFFSIDKRDFEKRSEYMMKKYHEEFE